MPPSLMLTSPSSCIRGNKGVKAKRPIPMAMASDTRPTTEIRKMEFIGNIASPRNLFLQSLTTPYSPI